MYLRNSNIHHFPIIIPITKGRKKTLQKINLSADTGTFTVEINLANDIPFKSLYPYRVTFPLLKGLKNPREKEREKFFF